LSKYELTIVPADYDLHIVKGKAHCVHCDSELIIVDHFVSLPNFPVVYESILSKCEGCRAVHLELQEEMTEFASPVVIEWS